MNAKGIHDLLREKDEIKRMVNPSIEVHLLGIVEDLRRYLGIVECVGKKTYYKIKVLKESINDFEGVNEEEGERIYEQHKIACNALCHPTKEKKEKCRLGFL